MTLNSEMTSFCFCSLAEAKLVNFAWARLSFFFLVAAPETGRIVNPFFPFLVTVSLSWLLRWPQPGCVYFGVVRVLAAHYLLVEGNGERCSRWWRWRWWRWY